MVIDCHVHLVSEKGYVDRLILEMDRLAINKVCLLAMQKFLFWGSRSSDKRSGLHRIREIS